MISQARHIYEFGPFCLIPEERQLLRDGQLVPLTPKAFDLLVVLVENGGHLIGKDELLKRVWPDSCVEEANLSVKMSALRRALGEGPNERQYVETVPRRGYRFVAGVKERWDNGAEPSPRESSEEDSPGRPVADHERQIPSLPAAEASRPRTLLRRWPLALIVLQLLPELLLWLDRVGLRERLLGKGDLAGRRARSWAFAAGVVALLALGWLGLARWKPEKFVTPKPVAIAVLPFKNLSAEPDSEYFVDGLTDEIIRNLSLIEGLEVRSRTSSFAFKDKPRDIREVGQQLKANFVVEGSVLRAGERLRFNAQLVRVADDVPLWSGRFDRELKDIFTIQDEISRSVVNELRLTLGRGKRRYDTNPETYELYLKARSLLGATVIPIPKVRKSAELFEQVIAKDPAFAPAYAGLANAYGAISIFTGPRAPGQPDREAAFAKMRPAAERALQLDPLLAEAHAAMGMVHRRELDWASAEKAFRRAIELNPNLAAAYVHLAYMVLCQTGRFEEALQELDKSIRTDPLSADPWEPRATALLCAGRYDEALESCRRALALDPEIIVV